MIIAALPANEAARLQALHSSGVLADHAEAKFAAITRLLSAQLQVSSAVVSFVDKDYQWFRSRQGIDVTQTPRDLSFCSHAILQEQLLEVPDTVLDPRFHDNPLVINHPQIRFYAGLPIQSPDGFVLGTLCCFDTHPRQLTDAERDLLHGLAKWVETEIRNLYITYHEFNARSAMLWHAQQLRLAQWRYVEEPQSVQIDPHWWELLGYPKQPSNLTLAELAARLETPAHFMQGRWNWVWRDASGQRRQSWLSSLDGLCGWIRLDAVAVAKPASLDLSRLSAMVGEESVLEVLAEFAQNLQTNTQLLAQAVQQRDHRQLEAVSHKLKSSCRLVGASQQAALLEQLELDCRQGTLEDLQQQWLRLQSPLQDLADEVQFKLAEPR